MTAQYVVDMQSIVKSFGDKVVLGGIDFQVKRQEKVIVCGPSGSGKSTLIRCINGLESITKGSLSVLGQRITDPDDWNKIRPSIGMLFQQFNLFPHLSILENCILAPSVVKGLPRHEAIDKAMHFLTRVRIADQADKYPVALSGGQMQRAAIARCLSMDPELILFDEPTSALDPEMIQEVLDAMLDLVETGITMVCVTHEMSFAKKFADRIVFVDSSEIVEQSTPEVFFSAPKTERAKQFLQLIDR